VLDHPVLLTIDDCLFLIFDLEEKNMKPQELEDRLIDFAVMVIGVVEALPNSKAGNHIAGQLVRSGTSPAPNYGEARSAESRKDFIHKMKISLKELRETVIWLKIISRKRLADEALTSGAIKECGELTAIFISSTRTADSESLSSKIKN
jgi:four helix bundle protein